MRKTTRILLIIFIISVILCIGFYTYKYFISYMKQVNIITNQEEAVGKKNYEDSREEVEGCRALKKDGRWGYVNSQGEPLTKFIYDFAHDFNDGYAVIKRDNRWGYVDILGKEVMENLGKSYMFDGKILLEGKGKTFEDAVEYKIKETSPILKSDVKKIDELNKNIIWIMEPEKIYEDINFVSQRNSFITEKDNLLGIVNSNYEIILPTQYNRMFDCGECGLNADSEYVYNGYYLKSGSCSGHGSPTEYKYYWDDGSKSIFLKETSEEGERIGIVAETTWISSEYKIVHEASIKKNESNEYEILEVKEKCGYAKDDNTLLTLLKYDNVCEFSSKYAAVSIGGKWSFINIAGEEITDFIYDKVYDFTEGYAAICKDGKWGYIDEKGIEVVSCVYEKTLPVVNGKCFIKKDGKWGIARINLE